MAKKLLDQICELVKLRNSMGLFSQMQLTHRLRAFCALVLCLVSLPGKALIFYGSGDANFNTTAPTGTLTNSGWELQGLWGGFQGTPIGPHHFITAGHLGGNVGDVFNFRGTNYTTVSVSQDPTSDLRIWEVAGTFPAFAQLYDGVSETGLDLMVFGRGMIRGSEVRVGGTLKGWQWGVWDMRMRWGRNKVSSVVNTAGLANGDLIYLKANFDSNATAEEAIVAGGDSGGGVFIQQSGVWRLAGVNLGADGPYNTVSTGPGFSAAIFDEGGVFQGGEGAWQQTLDTPLNQPGSFYATRIKARLTWIQGVLAQPPTTVLLEASDLAGGFSAVSGATVDLSTKTIRFTPVANHLYQLQSSVSTTIVSTRLEAGQMVIEYQ